jgi:hypothetical protein
MDWKDTNPKGIAATDRIPMSLFPDTARVYGNLGFLEGALKYGRYNWRVKGVLASTYVDALNRHMLKWWGGEWADSKTHIPHLASALCCVAILIDAFEHDVLTDDRPPTPDTCNIMTDMLDEYSYLVVHLRELFGHLNPVQYTIHDAVHTRASDDADDLDSALENSSGGGEPAEDAP